MRVWDVYVTVGDETKLVACCPSREAAIDTSNAWVSHFTCDSNEIKEREIKDQPPWMKPRYMTELTRGVQYDHHGVFKYAKYEAVFIIDNKEDYQP